MDFRGIYTRHRTILSARPCLPSWRVRSRPDLGGNLPATAPSRVPCFGGPSHHCLGSPHPPAAPRSHTPFPKLELGLGSRPTAPREPPACSICLERPREPISLDCGHDFCPRCFSTHRVPGCGPPCCPECRKTCKRRKGLRGLGERMRLLPQRPLPAAALQVPVWTWTEGAGRRRGRGDGGEQAGLSREDGGGGATEGRGLGAGRLTEWSLGPTGSSLVLKEPHLWAQETCAVRAEPLLLVRINASGGLILRMGAINRCLKHPLARDTPVCLLAVLGGPHSGKTFLLNHLLQGLPGLVSAGPGGGWGTGPGSQPGLAKGEGPDGPKLLCFSAPQASGEGGWPRGGGSGQGFRWGANGLSRGIWMWSHPFLLGKEGRKVRGEGTEGSRLTRAVWGGRGAERVVGRKILGARMRRQGGKGHGRGGTWQADLWLALHAGGRVPGGHGGRHEPRAKQGNEDPAVRPHLHAELLPGEALPAPQGSLHLPRAISAQPGPTKEGHLGPRAGSGGAPRRG